MRAIALGAIWFGLFVALSHFAPGFMDSTLYGSFEVGHALALSQFAMIALVGWSQVRRAEPEWDTGPSAPPQA
jgi:uncharacterized membrane protein (DUF485 family)